ncbi:hypothetical protein EMMF5_004437 [Cystobasidiomycetes sp. EMM_F5]
MTSLVLRHRARQLYKELHFLGREYPDAAYGFNKRLHQCFLAAGQRAANDDELQRAIDKAEYIKRELLALYSLKKSPAAVKMQSLPSLPSDWQSLSPEAIDTLIKETTRSASETRVAWFPVPVFVYFGLLYISAKFVEAALHHSSHTYRQLSFDIQRTVVIYVLNIVATTAALIVELLATPVLAQQLTTERLDLIRVGAALIAGLYLFELSYRESMRWQMITHHFIAKFAFGIYLLVWWALKQAQFHQTATDIAYSVIVVMFLVVLMGVQVYGAWVVYKIGTEVAQRYAKANNEGQQVSREGTPSMERSLQGSLNNSIMKESRQ